MADHPLRPATDRRLGEPLPHQLPNLTSAAPVAQGPCGSPAFIHGSHAVLIRLSPSYPALPGTFRCFTHPFATRRHPEGRAAVRLACVRHAASVQSEPGSNSSVQSQNSRSTSIPPESSNPSSTTHFFVRVLTSLRNIYNLIYKLNIPTKTKNPHLSIVQFLKS